MSNIEIEIQNDPTDRNVPTKSEDTVAFAKAYGIGDAGLTVTVQPTKQDAETTSLVLGMADDLEDWD